MEKISKKRKYLEILWGFLISLSIELIVILIILNMTVVPTYIQKNNIIKEKCEENIFQKIENIISNVSNHTYKWNVYDCSEFSEELVNRLNYSGISAYCVSGIVKNEHKWEGHTWVETIIDNQTYPIESTGGFIIDNETYAQKYKILKKGFCF